MKDIKYKSEKHAKCFEKIMRTKPSTIQKVLDDKLEISVIYIITDLEEDIVYAGNVSNVYLEMKKYWSTRNGIFKRIKKKSQK